MYDKGNTRSTECSIIIIFIILDNILIIAIFPYVIAAVVDRIWYHYLPCIYILSLLNNFYYFRNRLNNDCHHSESYFLSQSLSRCNELKGRREGLLSVTRGGGGKLRVRSYLKLKLMRVIMKSWNINICHPGQAYK